MPMARATPAPPPSSATSIRRRETAVREAIVVEEVRDLLNALPCVTPKLGRGVTRTCTPDGYQARRPEVASLQGTTTQITEIFDATLQKAAGARYRIVSRQAEEHTC